MKKAHPRLFIIFAKEANEAVIFRRGPSRWYHIIRWDTMHDKFYPGSWIKARIHPEKCDLSPDGNLLLCFIYKEVNVGSSYTTSWTAISRTPWLHALGLWPLGDTYGGGGRFVDNRTIVIRQPFSMPHSDHPGEGLKVSFGSAPLHYSSDEVDGSEWSGRDHSNRLVYISKGKLMRVTGKEQLCLADFNDIEKDIQPAPLWAKRTLI